MLSSVGLTGTMATVTAPSATATIAVSDERSELAQRAVPQGQVKVNEANQRSTASEMI